MRCIVVLCVIGMVVFTNNDKAKDVNAEGNTESLEQTESMTEAQKAAVCAEFSKNFKEYLSLNESTVSEEMQNEITEEVMEIYEIYEMDTAEADILTCEEKVSYFSAYAVENGLIEDTPQAKATLTKYTYRGLLKIVAEGGKALGLTISHDLLLHSLNDAPTDLYFYEGDAVTKAIKSTNIYRSLVRKCKKTLRDENEDFYEGSKESLVFVEPADLVYSLQKVDYRISARKKDGLWKITIKFYDTYDFRSEDWKGLNLKDAAKNALNEVGVNGQKTGAIVPYDITVTTEEAYRSSFVNYK